jgi:hypothetical protein
MGRTVAALLVWIALLAARPAAAEGLAVIVHGQRTDRPTIAEIAQIYLKQRRFWSDGMRIVPVNHPSDSAARAIFDRRVLGKDPAELVVYWNRQYFHGVLPPATLASDEAVKRFVASEREAIGYVDPRVVDDSVRVVLRLDQP